MSQSIIKLIVGYSLVPTALLLLALAACITFHANIGYAFFFGGTVFIIFGFIALIRETKLNNKNKLNAVNS